MSLFGLSFGLERYIGYSIYLAGILAFLLSIFWKPRVGIWYLTPLIPLQTTRYRMAAFPLGESVVGIILLGVAIGVVRRRQGLFAANPWSLVLAVYVVFTLGSLLSDAGYLGVRLTEWKDYMLMPLLFFLVAAAVSDAREMKIILLLMCAAVFVMDRSFWNAVSDRDFSTFSRDLQEGGAMGYAGVQGLAAFNAQFSWFLVALSGSQTARLARWGCLGLALFAANCTMYSFSRGAYVSFLAGWIFMGCVKIRKLLVILAIFVMTWASVVPPAVRDRILMTYDPNQGELDHAAGVRLVLWDEAMNLFSSNPVLGAGFNTYAHMEHFNNYADTHNIYVKVLVETGVAGLLLFLWLLGKTFLTGYGVFRRAQDPFFRSLGLGLAVWIVCTAVSSFFGDRWTYLQISGYMWILAGFVARAIRIEVSTAEEAPARGLEIAFDCGGAR